MFGVVARMTQNCRGAVQHDSSLARKHGAELFIMHVVNNPFGHKGWSWPTISLEAAKADLDRLEHLVFGRSNEALIRTMPCSILLVKK